MLAFEQGQQAAAVHVGGDWGSGKVKEGGGVVDVLHHLRNVAVCHRLVILGRHAHDEGCIETFLIHEALVEPSVLAHIEALVAGIDHEGVFAQSGAVEIVEQTAHIVVEGLEHLGIVAHETLVLEFLQGASRKVAAAEIDSKRIVESVVHGTLTAVEAADIGQIRVGEACGMLGVEHLHVIVHRHVVVRGDVHLLVGSGLTSFVTVVEIVGELEGNILVFTEIFQFGKPVAVAGLFVEEEGEGALRAVVIPRLSGILKPGDGLVRQEIRKVSLFHMCVAVHGDERGIVVLSLAGYDFIMVETGRRTHQVPLANEGRGIACCLEQFGHGLLAAVENAVFVVRKTVGMTVFAGYHAGSGRTAEGVRHITVDEPHTVLRNTVEVGGADMGAVIARHHLGGMVVCHDVEHVVTHLGESGTGQCDSKCQETFFHILEDVCVFMIRSTTQSVPGYFFTKVLRAQP